MSDNNITSIDRPRCSRCKKYKPIDELNGYNPNPFAPVGQKYKNAYCRSLKDCDSDETRRIIRELSKYIKR